MKTNWQLFGGLSVFYVLMSVVYYYVGGEPVGITGMILAACLAGMVGFYVWFTQKRIGRLLPEDRAGGLWQRGGHHRDLLRRRPDRRHAPHRQYGSERACLTHPDIDAPRDSMAWAPAKPERV